MGAPRIRLVLGAAVFAAAMSGCATPHVVDEIKISDNDLGCRALQAEITEAQKYEGLADKGAETVSDDVVVYGVLAPPMWALLPVTIARDVMESSNVKEAKTAAQKRQNHLRSLYRDKCANKSSKEKENKQP